jgi:hypothetical protein
MTSPYFAIFFLNLEVGTVGIDYQQLTTASLHQLGNS